MRNEPKPLNRQQARHAYAMQAALEAEQAAGKRVTVRYTKRNGDKSESSGTVEFFNGSEGMDTMSVTIGTSDKGPRTINLVGITTIFEDGLTKR